MAEQKPSPPSPVRTLPPVITQQAKPSAQAPAPVKKRAGVSSLPFWFGMLLSIVWVGGIFLLIAHSGPAGALAGVPLATWAIGISAIASPVALIWMVTAYLQRASDIQLITEPLRRQLMMVTGESGAAEARIKRFNQAIKEQIELLKSMQGVSQKDFAAVMDRVRQHRNELERFEHDSVHQVKEIQEIIRRNMQHVEQLMEDKFTMMRILDDKLVQSGDSVARQVEGTRDQIADLLSRLDIGSQQVSSTLERTIQDSKRLSDVSQAQEASLLTAAESAAETLSGVSSKIDLSIARFLERAGTARSEAENLAGVLDAQTRALDEFSNTLPVRVSEAEAVLRGVADRLASGEKAAREQAVSLSEKLATQADSLQQFLDRFTARLTDIDGTLLQRRADLDSIVGRIGETTESFAQRWENSITDLSDRTNNCLERFTVANDQTRKGADEVSAQLTSTAERYESAAERMQTLSSDSTAQLKAISSQIGGQLGQFESLQDASRKAGQEVEDRATAAMQNLQYILERLLTAREATQTVGETLTRDLYKAVDQNEQLIGRLNEAAQMSVRALGIAAESLGRQEGELAGQARSAMTMLQEAMVQTETRAKMAETGLREQASGLMALLAETQTQLNATDQRMQNFAAQTITPIREIVQQVDQSADQGLQSLSRYGDGLQEQLTRLQQFTTRVGGMGEELGRVTSANLSSIEQLSGRYSSMRTAQEETSHQMLEQFSALADRLQTEVSGLSDKTAQAVSTLREAAAGVGEQSNQLLQNAQNSSGQLQAVTGALQSEAAQLRAILQKQADELGADLARAEKQFAAIGETFKQRTDAAYELLDRAAAHYNEVTQTATAEVEGRVQRFEKVAAEAQTRADAFGTALTQNLGLMNTGAAQIETQAEQIAATSGKTMQQLSAFSEKFALTHEVANTNVQQTMAKLEEYNSAFARNGSSVAEAAQAAIALIQKAGASFGEQAGKMLDNSHQTEQHIRNLTSATMALSEQSSQIRASMEQQNQRLIAQLSEAVARLDMAGGKLQQTTAAAATGAEQATAKFEEMAQTASSKLGSSQQELQNAASRTENTLAALSTNISQQATSLASVNEQLGEQYRTLNAANENQRAQLVDLFDKLGAAHGQASDVAERTIARLTDSLQQIQRHLGAISDQSQSAVGNVRMASATFTEQAGTLLQNAQQAEQQARAVLSVTAALQDQARTLRESLTTEAERSHELLGGLLGRLTSGSGELREAGAAAELILTSVQTNFAQQTQALNGVTQQIAERQRGLTVTLDAQRDVINGILNRLALAQDETAAAAERSAARMADSTQQITKQLGAIENQAQSALISVQTASASFADEAGTLNMHAQQAEQQMRAVLSVTAGMQEQARSLRESMQSEASHVIEQMSGILGQLDGASEKLKQQAGNSIVAMDQAAMQFESLTRASGEQIKKQAENLATAADQADARITGADERIRTHVRFIGDASAETERHSRQIAETVESAVTRMASLRTAMADGDKEGRTALAQVGARIDEVKAALRNEMQNLFETSQLASQRVTTAARDLVVQSDALRANLASSESALAEAARLVRDETVQLPVTLDRSTAQIQAAGDALKTGAREADKTLLGIADRFIAVTGSARDAMADEMGKVGHIAEQADQALRAFNKALSEQVQTAQGSVGLLSTTQRDIVARANESVAQLTTAGERLGQLRNDAMQSAQKLAREFETLEGRAAATGQRITEAGDAVGRNVEVLAQVSQRIEGQMASAATHFREQLEHVRSGVQGQIDDINRGLMQITAQLERTGNALRSTTAGTVADVEKISARFDQTSKEAASTLVDKTARMRLATEEVATLLSGFGDQLDVLLNRLSMAGDGIKRHEGDLVGQMQSALTHLSSVAERLESSRMLAGNVSEQAVARLSDVAQAVEQQMNDFSGKSENTVRLIRNMGQAYGEQGQSFGKGMTEAQTQVAAMNRAIDDMQQRTDRLRVSLKLQGEELMGSLQQIMAQLAMTGDSLSETVDDVLREQAAKNMKKIG